MMRYARCMRLLLLCVLLTLARGGSVAVQAQAEIDPRIDYLIPIGHLGGSATAFELLEDDYACLAIGEDFLILDTLDPFHPVQIGKLSFTSLINDINVIGNHAYVLVGGRIQVVDLSDPHQPRKLSVLPPLDVRDIDADDNYLYIAAPDFFIYSISDPTAPEWISTYQDIYYDGEGYGINPGLKVVAAFPYLYIQVQTVSCPLWCYPPSISPGIIDISQPANPVKVNPWPVYRITKVHALTEIQDFTFVSGEFYTGAESGSGILIVDHADMATLTPSAIIPHWGNDLTIDGSTLYVADSEGGIRIFDITNPLSPVELSWESSIPDPRSIAVQDRTAFVAGGTQGLVTLNVRYPASPFPSGGFRTVGAARRVTIAGSYLYASSDRLDVVDISDPANPILIGEFNRSGFPAVAGEVLYLAAGSAGLAAVDIRNPSAPFELDLLALPGGAAAVAINANYAYVTTGEGQLHVVDITDPRTLSLANSLSAQPATEIAISDGFAYLMGGSDVSFFDLTLPDSPELVFQHAIYISDGGNCFGPGITRGIAAEGDRVFVIYDFYIEVAKVCGISGNNLLVFKRGAQNIWQLSSDTGLPAAGPTDIEVSNGIGYILIGQFLLVFDAVNPPYTNSVASYQFTTWIPTADLAIEGELVVVGRAEEGIHLLRWSDPQLYFPIIHAQ